MSLSATSVTIIPVLTLSAIRQGRGGAVRAWEIVRHLDKQSGNVSGNYPREEAEKFAGACGIPRRRWNRWFKDALNEGWFRVIERRRSNAVIQIISYIGVEKLALDLGIDRVGRRPAEMPIELLAEHDCLQYVWAAYLSTLYAVPISRATMRRQTGVPERTQIRYERELQIRKTPNYAVAEVSADHFDGFREHHGGHVLKLFDADTGKTIIIWRLPDVRETTTPGIGPVRSNAGRRINHALAAVRVNVDPDRAGGIVRLFQPSEKSCKTAINKIRKLSSQKHAPKLPDGFYRRAYLKSKMSGARFWRWEATQGQVQR